MVIDTSEPNRKFSACSTDKIIDLVTLRGESVSHHTACAKQRQYADADNVIAFKFNIRFVYDMEDEEYDLGAAEIARMPPDDDKIIRDQGKLVREGKETVDMITRALCGSNANAAIASCIMPFCGIPVTMSRIRSRY